MVTIARRTSLVLFCMYVLGSWYPGKFAQSSTSINYSERLRLGYGVPHGSTWSPDGKEFAVASSSGLWIFDNLSTKPRQLTSENITSAYWNPGGKSILVIGTNATELLDIQSGTATKLPIAGVTIAMWDFTGERVALADTANRLSVWSNNALRFLQGNETSTHIFGLAWVPDSHLLLSVDEINHPSGMRMPTLTPTGAAGNLNGMGCGRLISWDTVTNYEISTRTLDCQGHIDQVAWHPAATQLVVSASDSLFLFDVATGKLLTSQKFARPLQTLSLRWSPDGKLLAGADDVANIRVWDASTLKQERQFFVPIGHLQDEVSVNWSPDNHQLLVITAGSVSLWSPETGTKIRDFQGFMAGANEVAWSPDGKYIATAHGSQSIPDYRIRIWDAQTGQIVCVLEGHTGPVSGIGWNPESSELVSSGSEPDDGSLRVWDVLNCSQIEITQPHVPIDTPRWSPDGRYIAASVSAMVIVWPANLQGTPIMFTNTLGAGPAWDPAGTRIAGGAGSDILIIDLSGHNPVSTLTGHKDRVNTLQWSPDGTLLASGSGRFLIDDGGNSLSTPVGGYDDTVRIWDTRSSNVRFIFTGHLYPVNTVAWRPDGTILASGSDDGTVKLWDTATGMLRATISSEQQPIYSIAWSHDGKELAMAGKSDSLIIWDVGR